MHSRQLAKCITLQDPDKCKRQKVGAKVDADMGDVTPDEHAMTLSNGQSTEDVAGPEASATNAMAPPPPRRPQPVCA